MTAAFRSFSEFIGAAQVLSERAAARLRERFVEIRVDVGSPSAADALRLRHFSDGLAYTGYLWDHLVDKRVVTEAELWRMLAPVKGFYAMGDIHSTDLVRVSSDFLLPRGAVIQTDPEVLRQGIEFLPEDLYVFDEGCEWAAALTHEWVGNERFCLWSGRRPTDVRRPEGPDGAESDGNPAS
jgi:hypothetical protein